MDCKYFILLCLAFILMSLTIFEEVATFVKSTTSTAVSIDFQKEDKMVNQQRKSSTIVVLLQQVDEGQFESRKLYPFCYAAYTSLQIMKVTTKLQSGEYGTAYVAVAETPRKSLISDSLAIYCDHGREEKYKGSHGEKLSDTDLKGLNLIVMFVPTAYDEYIQKLDNNPWYTTAEISSDASNKAIVLDPYSRAGIYISREEIYEDLLPFTFDDMLEDAYIKSQEYFTRTLVYREKDLIKTNIDAKVMQFRNIFKLKTAIYVNWGEDYTTRMKKYSLHSLFSLALVVTTTFLCINTCCNICRKKNQGEDIPREGHELLQDITSNT